MIHDSILRLALVRSLFAAATLCLGLAGCTQTDPNGNGGSHEDGGHGQHDADHDHPTSYTAAIAELTKHRNSIRDLAADGKLEDDHEALHDVAHLLDNLPALARDSGLSDEACQAVKEKADELFELFGQVDAKLHGDEGVDYDEVSAKIDATLAAMPEKANANGGNDHAGEDSN